MSTSTQVIQDLARREYKYGFVTDVEQETATAYWSLVTARDSERVLADIRAQRSAAAAQLADPHEHAHDHAHAHAAS